MECVWLGVWSKTARPWGSAARRFGENCPTQLHSPLQLGAGAVLLGRWFESSLWRLVFWSFLRLRLALRSKGLHSAGLPVLQCPLLHLVRGQICAHLSSRGGTWGLLWSSQGHVLLPLILTQNCRRKDKTEGPDSPACVAAIEGLIPEISINSDGFFFLFHFHLSFFFFLNTACRLFPDQYFTL